jgi:MFS transporter, DHA1 family, multidrug resistance protein
METWKRNLYVLWVSELLAIAGFSVVFPFLPYYIQELGVTDPAQVALWSGVIIAIQAVTMTIFSPIWGAVADRYGRKLMVERATFGGAVVLALMGFVQNVGQLAVLRAIQGILTGTVAAAMTLVASSTPRERSGYALGLLQMSIWIGSSVGPLIGGVVADTWGYRAAFWITGALLLISGVTVWLFVKEDFTPPPRDQRHPRDSLWAGLKLVLATGSLVALLAVRIIVRLGTSLTTPILALFVQSLAAPDARVASLTGLISGVAAATSAASVVILGKAGDRTGYRRVLLISTVATAVLFVPQFFVTTPWQLLILQGAVGFTLGGVMASISASQAKLSPEGRQGAVYGLDASATSVASAVGPMIGASMAAGLGLRLPFLLTAGIFGLAACLIWALVPADKKEQAG